MLEDLCSCPCFDFRSSDDTEVDRDSVLLVSSIGGSILHSKKKSHPPPPP
ncbi:putative phosphatidylcholine-sterol O-acyltransferase [Corchorus olitorius]|uniref:Phosphatidylcholine-sterol O-acyltransferase n=1 Tax=Corchorus olitorius TaxID=93759 RepID=A0A1R3I5F4_9ROSI|nr:putative phosphatidylcholine-sterol O-acyltransferase [Corchorus olitorius]